MHPETRRDMPLDTEPKPLPRKAASGVEPLRRRRVQPEPVTVSPRGRRILNVLLGFATVVVMVDALVGEKGLVARMRARAELQKQYASVQTLKQQNVKLRDQAESLRDDPAAIEAVAREELGLIRDGELLFILRDVKSAHDVKPTSADPGAAPAKAADDVK